MKSLAICEKAIVEIPNMSSLPGILLTPFPNLSSPCFSLHLPLCTHKPVKSEKSVEPSYRGALVGNFFLSWVFQAQQKDYKTAPIQPPPHPSLPQEKQNILLCHSWRMALYDQNPTLDNILPFILLSSHVVVSFHCSFSSISCIFKPSKQSVCLI